MNRKTLALCLLSAVLPDICARAASQGMILPHPRVPGDAASSDFISVMVDGVPVEACTTVMNVGYAHFSFTGTVKVEITVKEAIRTFDLSPHRYAVMAKAEGSKLTFELSEPRKLHLQVNGLTRFFIFADGPDTSTPRLGQPGVYDVKVYGVKCTPDTVQTAALQRAIDDVASKRGVLLVPPGIYRTGELRMKSNLTLHLEAGAILKGTGSLADHPAGEFGTQLIYFLDCAHVRIQGRGVIDCQGRALRLGGRNSSQSRCKLIRSYRASQCVVEDVILRDSGTWGVHLVESENLRFSNFKLISTTKHDDPAFPWELNTDGIDPDNSSHVLIENGFISCNDDGVAVKLRYGKRRDMDDIQVRSNVIWTMKSALVIGTEVAERTLSNFVFENNEVVHADRGMSMNCYFGGSIVGPKWINNYFEFIGGDLKRMHMEMKIRDEEGKGRIRDVLIQDNTFERECENRSRLQGLDAEHAITGVTIENLVIAGRKRTRAEDAGIEVSRHVSGVTFK